MPSGAVIIGHLDLDAFFAAVEQLDRPEFASVPLVVGGDPDGRGVVATANYAARRFGIHSAMSCAEARRRCPEVVFVRPRHPRYAEVSRTVWAAVREVVPTVERTGIDEGYLQLDEVADDVRQARRIAEAVQAAVRGASGLTCSIGVGTCKVVAKVASDRRKPGGIVVVAPGGEADFLAPFDVRLLPGVGPRAEARLRVAGVATIGDLAALAEAVQVAVKGSTSLSASLGVGTCKVVAKVASDRRKPGGITVVLPGREAAFLAALYVRKLPGVGPRAEQRLAEGGVATVGALAALDDAALRRLLPGKVGAMLRDRGRGIDPRKLELSTEPVSISNEETFDRDISDRERLADEVRRMATRLAEVLERKGYTARTITTKVRYPDFSIRSRSTSLPVGIDDGERIGELACQMLERALKDRPGALRLVGVGLSGLETHRQLALV